ncbi:amidophosphoribosyltransferase [Citricoccus sp. NR2]|uniref:amidophosphoribosyltransferase n=1 Tax=Citricoccus sp. NR2 TaxID=3004095 RepID=UPI0022DD34E2|nr:amidophosphoribosyltransferase [Citricoccus sp. NR2]WBL20427.1 amidophosphoribosyltransferase [Citricoccus sp. NR2]
MCGIVGHVSAGPVNQQVYDSLLLVQHRGQDSTGIATADGRTLHQSKKSGQVREAYRTRDMRELLGNIGLGHVRYATKGHATNLDEAQPFYVNAPYGIVLVHNGNLTNTRELTQQMRERDFRHLNSSSDTELLLNVLASSLQDNVGNRHLDADAIFEAVTKVHSRIRGAYGVIALIAGHGLLAFRDPLGIRPLVLGRRQVTEEIAEAARTYRETHGLSDELPEQEWVVASESLVLEAGGYEVVREIAPGEAVFIDEAGRMQSQQCATDTSLVPCAFEYVYLARPDSVMNGISVYEARLRMGEKLAQTVRQHVPDDDFDVVMPIPDSARPAALQVAHTLGKEYREGFYKNRYVGRTFIMPGQEVRQKSVRQKLNAMRSEFEGKKVLIIDDSIVRGTTSKQIVEMAYEAGAVKVTFASAAPPVRYPHVYGINMPNAEELVAHNRSVEDVRKILGCDHLVYLGVEDMAEAIMADTDWDGLEMSCFTGEYVTGDVTEEYLEFVAGDQES